MFQKAFIIYLIAINIIAYAMMCYDKARAIQKQNRISEQSLFLAALAFGSLGIYCGMKAPVYHKSAKIKFKIGIPLLIILNAVSVYFITISIK